MIIHKELHMHLVILSVAFGTEHSRCIGKWECHIETCVGTENHS